MIWGFCTLGRFGAFLHLHCLFEEAAEEGRQAQRERLDELQEAVVQVTWPGRWKLLSMASIERIR